MTTYHVLREDFGELDHFLTMLLELEAQAQESGWGTILPTLFRVDVLHDGKEPAANSPLLEAACLAKYELSPFVFDGQIGNTFAEEFNNLVQMVALPITRTLIHNKYPYPPVAHLFISEAWMTDREDVYESLPELRRTGRTLEDVPGSQLTRYAIAICGDKYIVASRHQPHGDNVDIVVSDDNIPVGGGLIPALLLLHKTEQEAYEPADAKVEAFAARLDEYIQTILDEVKDD